jgi:hypothetical protein
MMMINESKFERPFAACVAHGKDTPTLGQELLSVLRFVFDQPERRLRATDFVWSYQELGDDIPD